MKIRDVMERLSKLDPDMDMNDLREAFTTSRAESDELVASIDTDTDHWDEFSAMLTKGAVLPLLHEIRDLMLMPTSARGWLKPTEMAKKVAEQVEINEAKCQERIAEEAKTHKEVAEAARVRHVQEVIDVESSKESRLCEMSRRHDVTVAELKATHEDRVESLLQAREYETDGYQERIAEASRQNEELSENMMEAVRAVPSQQAEAVARVLTDAADRVEAMAQMRLTRLVKRKSFFRNKDLDQMMLRVEADGIMCSAKRLRQMAAEAEEQGVWPVEFASGEEDSLEAKEALARILTPIREVEAPAEAAEAEVEVEAD